METRKYKFISCGKQKMTKEMLGNQPIFATIWIGVRPTKCPICGEKIKDFKKHVSDKHDGEYI